MGLRDHWKEIVMPLFYGVVSFSVNVQLRTYGHEHNNPFLTSYTNDFFGPFGAYWGNKFLSDVFDLPFGKSRILNTVTVFAYCSFVELGQYLGYEKGTFDPYDFLAYVAGVGLAVGVDRLTFGKEKKGLESLVKE